MKVNPDRQFTLKRGWKTIMTITNNTGVEGLWRGNLAQMKRVMPYAGIQFMTYSRYESFLKAKLGGSRDVESRFVAGACAGATATTFTYPFELVRVRLAAHWNLQPKYSGGWLLPYQAIIREEGPKALFKGLFPTLLGVAPLTGISFGIFETTKAWIKDVRGYKSVRSMFSCCYCY